MRTLLSAILLVGVLVACDTNTAALPTEGAVSLLSADGQAALGEAVGSVNAVTPSTNAINAGKGWAFVMIDGVDGARVGEIGS